MKLEQVIEGEINEFVHNLIQEKMNDDGNIALELNDIKLRLREALKQTALAVREEIAKEMVARAGMEDNNISLRFDPETFTGTYWISANNLYHQLTGRHLNHDLEKGHLEENPHFTELQSITNDKEQRDED